MKLLKSTLIITILSVFLFNCKSAYVHNDFNTKTANHSKIAVLPFKIVTTGNLKKDLKESDIKKIQEEESVLFQTSLINQLLKKDAQRGNKDMKVEILSLASTNAILKEKGYSISDITTMDPSKLAAILNVDAVVSSTIQKQRYMSNLASAGVELGNRILQKFDINVDNRTNDIYITSNIVNKNDGSNLFSISKKTRIDWRSNTNNIVENVNRKITRNFPYLN